MKNKIYFGIGFIALCLVCGFAANAATAPRATKATLSVIQQGTKIREKVSSDSLYSKECYDAYFGCMDEFCRTDNESGGSCQCSDENAGYEKQMSDIQTRLLDVHALSDIEVEKITAGAQADIIFNDFGERKYDDKGNVITVYKQTAAQKKEDRKKRQDELLKSWSDAYSDSDYDEDADGIASKTGMTLYSAANEVCRGQMPEACAEKDGSILRQLYQTDIKNSCVSFGNAVATAKTKADAEIYDAQKNVRDARLLAFDQANEYDRGTCLIEFKRCFVKAEVCGADWNRCVDSVASENMQNKKAVSVANTTVSHTAKFRITDSTLEMVNSKRNMCENILDKCMAVRDFIWDDFLRDVSPELNVAELNAESKKRQSCMTDISNCIMGTACADTIGNNANSVNIDACLSKDGQIARAACKNVIDPCERMEPKIWDYVVARLKSTAVDRCTEEVKNCILAPAPIGCGANFENCIGVDYKYMHELCPLEKLVVCKQTFAASGSEFTMNDLDRLLMGFYLNVDNSALDNCQNIIDSKMSEICDSTTDCNKFATDDVLGSNSIKFQKLKDVYRITGMISFGSLKIGDGLSVKDGSKKLEVGQVGVADYIAKVKEGNNGVPNRDAIIENIQAELENIASQINRTIELIGMDQRVQYCITGRDLSQVIGKNEKTAPRFPNLMHQTKMVVAESALRVANDNYNKKLKEEIAKAMKDASADVAQYMCQKMAASGTAEGGAADAAEVSTPLTAPYAISYDLAVGMSLENLLKNGHGQYDLGTGTKTTSGGTANFLGNIIKDGTHYTSEFGGVKRETWAVFNREGRICHMCTSTASQECKTKGSRGIFGLWDSRGVECKAADVQESCEDIEM